MVQRPADSNRYLDLTVAELEAEMAALEAVSGVREQLELILSRQERPDMIHLILLASGLLSAAVYEGCAEACEERRVWDLTPIRSAREVLLALAEQPIRKSEAA